jgi:hypothetical protein
MNGSLLSCSREFGDDFEAVSIRFKGPCVGPVGFRFGSEQTVTKNKQFPLFLIL